MAAKVDAKVGIEFEMYVPDVKTVGGNDDPEDEWIDADDRRVNDIDDVIDFYYNGGDSTGTRNDRDRFREELESEFQEWNESFKENEWKSNGQAYLKDYIVDDVIEDETVVEKMRENGNLNPIAEDLFDRYTFGNLRRFYRNRTEAVNTLTQEELDTLLEMVPVFLEIRDELGDEMSEESWSSEDEHYDAAKEKYMDEEVSDGEERDFFDEKYGREASDFRRVAERHDFYWPSWANPDYNNSDGDADEIQDHEVENVADVFERITGFDTKYGGDYHSAERDGTSWVVEPDSSLTSRNADEDHGLEFVSPPLTLSEMYDALEQVKVYTKKKKCYTDESCGLHINVSVANMDKLDIFKLLVFMGDQHVLAQYGRELIHYCQSAYKKMTNNSKRLSADKLEKFLSNTEYRANLKMTDDIVITLMGGVIGEKYVSTNLHRLNSPDKVDYIEFRSPGGDWIDGDVSTKIVDTINRFVVALDIACDPERYKQEYAKKLYKAIARNSEDLLAGLMSKSMAGTLSQSELKSALSQLSSSRLESGGSKPVLVQVYSNRTDDHQRSPYTLNVIAKSKKEALLIAYKEWKIEESTNLSLEDAVRQLDLDVRVVNMKPPVDHPKVSRPEGLTPAWYLVRDTSYTHPPVLSKAYTLRKRDIMHVLTIEN
ncbi:hypothetical protein GHT06_001880 [Daphnia sinensis]|uniref:Amidoligase enzyme n=1 Tax=Daphnia sinensis TaxID=1820382 RepID=A0AAD5PNE2_9CRUS|nr:hypothetical protein GHT06_001880 [Daphnia sinensis]